MFENPEFQVDADSEEYKLLHPSLPRHDKKKNKPGTEEESGDESSDEASELEDNDSEDSDKQGADNALTRKPFITIHSGNMVSHSNIRYSRANEFISIIKHLLLPLIHVRYATLQWVYCISGTTMPIFGRAI